MIPTTLLVIIRGLPGSGKSTLAEVLFNHYLERGAAVVTLAADDYFYEEDEGGLVYAYDPARIPEVHRLCLTDAKHFLDRNYIVIVHNTFSQNWEMKPYVDHAKKVGIKVQVIETKGPWQSVHGVPQEKVDAMRKRWEAYGC